MAVGAQGEEYIIAARETPTMVEVFDLAEDITGIPAPRSGTLWVFDAEFTFGQTAKTEGR